MYSVTTFQQFLSSAILDIDSKLYKSKVENKKLRALGKSFYPSEKDKLKKAPRTLRELNKLDDLDPAKQGYLNALQSEMDFLIIHLHVTILSHDNISTSMLVFNK
jgi:hypothetical protein